MGYVGGGGNLLTIYEGIDSEHNLTASTYADAAFEFDKNTEVAIDKDDATGYRGFTLTQTKMTPALSAKIDLWAPPSVSGEMEEVTYTDGVKEGGNTGSSPDLLAVNHGSVHTDAAIDQLPLVITVVKATLGSGARTEAANTMGKPAIVFVGQKVKKAISVPAALVCSVKATVSAPIAISANSGGIETWVDPA